MVMFVNTEKMNRAGLLTAEHVIRFAEQYMSVNTAVNDSGELVKIHRTVHVCEYCIK